MEELPKQDIKEDSEGFTLPKFSPFVTRIIIVSCLALIVFFAMWIAYGYGGVKACASAEGLLDDKFVCHAGMTKDGKVLPQKLKGMPQDLPKFIIPNG